MVVTSNLSARREALSAQQREMLKRRIRGETPPLQSSLPPIGLRGRSVGARLSFSQERLWFLDQLSPGSAFYNIQTAVHIAGAVDPALLERAINSVVQRHEILRTTFRVDSEPLQFVAESLRAPLRQVCLSHLRREERDAEAVSLASREASLPFDLERGPLLRTVLVGLDTADFVFLLTIHHIVCDGWSLGIIGQEISAFYATLAAGRQPSLPGLPLQYADYAAWQREWLQGPELDRQLEYWRRELKDLPTLELPADRPRPPVATFSGASVPVALGAQLSRDIVASAARIGVTAFMLLLAGFQALLSRLSGATDVPVGVPVAGRSRPELEPLVGFFINSLVLRGRLDDDPTFAESVSRVRATALKAYAHQDLPFERLVEALQTRRDLSRNPLFQITFQLFSSPQGGTSSAVGPATGPVAERGASPFDLAFNLVDTADGVFGQVEYSSDLFDKTTVERWVQHFLVLLDAAVSRPETRISQLPLLTPAERNRILYEWNDTQADYPRDATAYQLFEAQARENPEAIAIEFEGQSTSYGQLIRRASRLGDVLRARGVGPGSRVGLLLRRSPALVESLLGVLASGAAYVPLDPTYPPERLAFMIRDSEAAVVLTEPELARLAPVEGPPQLCPDVNADRLEVSQTGARRPRNATAADIAYVMYTSGSTGIPKGAMITNRGLVNYLTWAVRAYEVAAGSGALVHSSISFDLTVTSLLAPLMAGRTARLLPGDTDATRLSKVLMCRGGFSLLKLTPAHLRVMSHEIDPAKAEDMTRFIVVGGENLLASDLAFWRRFAPGATIVNEYGPTETVVGCCVHFVSERTPDTGSIPIGRPIANTRLYVLDRWLNPVPVGVPGELYIGGDGVALGYHNRPELTAERFIADPHGSDGSRLYRTGDFAKYLPDGTLIFLGRRDDQVKIRGYRIELAEIEAVAASHPMVRHVTVVAREISADDLGLVAYVQPSDECAHEPEMEVRLVTALRTHLREWLPDYMVPSLVFVLPALPLTANGKIDRWALPAPEALPRPGRKNHEPPASSTERIIAEVWAEVLHAERVGRHDHLFEDLGGHSLVVARLAARLRQIFRTEFPLRRFFEAPTVAELAAAMLADPGKGATIERTADLLMMIRHLSDDEIEALDPGAVATGSPRSSTASQEPTP
jgi:amino acid adenylation domain-containing protein